MNASRGQVIYVGFNCPLPFGLDGAALLIDYQLSLDKICEDSWEKEDATDAARYFGRAVPVVSDPDE